MFDNVKQTKKLWKTAAKVLDKEKKEKEQDINKDVIKILAFILLLPYYFYIIYPFS